MIEITRKIIDELFNKDRIEAIETARRYYANKNDICERKREIVAPDGSMIESKFLTNNKLSHPFVRKIVEQKVAYLLGKPFNLKSDDKVLLDNALAFYDRKFMRMLRSVCRDAILCGESWVMVYYDESGMLEFRHIKTENIGAVYEDEYEEKLSAVVRKYKDADTDFFEVWDSESVQVYADIAGELRLQSKRAHFGGNDDGDTSGYGRVPFVRFKYNALGIGILNFVKSLVDDYDRISSDLSNLLQDTPNTMRIIKGYGDNPEILVRNMAMYNLVMMAPDSDITTLQNTIDIQASEAHMTRLRKDILDSACAVDTQEASQGNLSGVAIKFRFADLDLDCQQMGSEFAASLEELTWFICEDLEAQGAGVHDPADLTFVWATELIANEQEVIQNLQNSAEILSIETRIEQHPYVDDPAAELVRLNEERNGVPGEV